MASPHWKTGRYSKYLPASLLTKYHEAQRDPDLLNLRDEIGLLDARLKQLIEKLPEGGASHSWKEVQDTWKELIEAQRGGDQNKTTEVLRKMNEIITEGADEAKLWNDIIVSVDNRRKLSASEAKRLTDMRQTITAEKAIALVYAVLDIIRRNVTSYRDKGKVADDRLLSGIAEDVRALVTLPARTIEQDIVE